MVEIALVMTFVSVTSFIYFLMDNWQSSNRQIKTRLERLKPVVPIYQQLNVDLEKPLLIRIFHPLIHRISKIATKLAPKQMHQQTEHLLELAGHPGNLKVNEFLTIKFTINLGLPVLAYFTLARTNPASGLMIVVASFILGMIMPDFFLKRQVTARQQKIADALPDNLDLLTVSVEAGLGFDQALLKVVEKSSGPLAEEFKHVLHEMRIGKARRDALRELTIRTGVDELQSFVAALIQADQLGVSIGNVLRIQSQQLRQNRRLRAEEKAQKAPVKMLIPMILFIFPSLFIILLGPGALQMIDNFSKVK